MCKQRLNPDGSRQRLWRSIVFLISCSGTGLQYTIDRFKGSGSLSSWQRSVPRTVAAHMALLAPHLGCGAYPIRSGIVTAVGHLLHGAFEPGVRDDAGAQGGLLHATVASCLKGRRSEACSLNGLLVVHWSMWHGWYGLYSCHCKLPASQRSRLQDLQTTRQADSLMNSVQRLTLCGCAPAQFRSFPHLDSDFGPTSENSLRPQAPARGCGRCRRCWTR